MAEQSHGNEQQGAGNQFKHQVHNPRHAPGEEHRLGKCAVISPVGRRVGAVQHQRVDGEAEEEVNQRENDAVAKQPHSHGAKAGVQLAEQKQEAVQKQKHAAGMMGNLGKCSHASSPPFRNTTSV